MHAIQPNISSIAFARSLLAFFATDRTSGRSAGPSLSFGLLVFRPVDIGVAENILIGVLEGAFPKFSPSIAAWSRSGGVVVKVPIVRGMRVASGREMDTPMSAMGRSTGITPRSSFCRIEAVLSPPSSAFSGGYVVVE